MIGFRHKDVVLDSLLSSGAQVASPRYLLKFKQNAKLWISRLVSKSGISSEDVVGRETSRGAVGPEAQSTSTVSSFPHRHAGAFASRRYPATAVIGFAWGGFLTVICKRLRNHGGLECLFNRAAAWRAQGDRFGAASSASGLVAIFFSLGRNLLLSCRMASADKMKAWTESGWMPGCGQRGFSRLVRWPRRTAT